MPFAHHDGVRIYYEVDGVGAPLVLQHGLSDSIPIWREYGLAARLRAHHRLIMIDARGHGHSDKPHEPAAYALKLRVGDVLAVLDALDIDQSGYYGYSMGGWMGYGMALHAPERLSSMLIGGAHPYAASTAPFRHLFAGGMLAWLELLEKMAGPVPFITRERLLSNDVDALRASVAHDRPDLSAQLAGVPLAWRLFVGTADSDYPRIHQCASELAARFWALDGMNHFQTYLASDQVAAIVLDGGTPSTMEHEPQRRASDATHLRDHV